MKKPLSPEDKELLKWAELFYRAEKLKEQFGSEMVDKLLPPELKEFIYGVKKNE